MVPFPVSSPQDPFARISVRVGSATLWPTVRSTHELGNASYSLKQYAMDWFGHFGAPNKLYRTRPNRWEAYGPMTRLDVGSRSAFHGRDWSGAEAASLVTLGTHIELRVLNGHLGPMKTAAILRGISPVSAFDALALARRPLVDWNWSLQSGWLPNATQSRKLGHLRRGIHGKDSRRTARALEGFPVLRGWSLDCAGSNVPGRNAQRIRIALYRSLDLNTTLEIDIAQGKEPGTERRRQIPPGPMFSLRRAGIEGAQYFRSAPLKWAKILLNIGATTVEVTVPPGRSSLLEDRRTAHSILDVDYAR